MPDQSTTGKKNKATCGSATLPMPDCDQEGESTSAISIPARPPTRRIVAGVESLFNKKVSMYHTISSRLTKPIRTRCRYAITYERFI